MRKEQQKWIYLGVLSLVWGSSFILMKKALLGVTSFQLGALRVVFAALFMFLIGFKSIRKIQKNQWKVIIFTAFVGTFFPVFLFSLAVENIDSAIVSILNCLTPFNTLIFGAMMFGFSIKKNQFIGIIVGLIGTTILILKGAALNPNQNYAYAGLIVVASFGYALNVNMIKKYLQNLDALAITTGHFLVIFIPALLVLVHTGFFSEFQFNETYFKSMGYIAVLAIVGTGIAKIIFNKMVQIASPIFASSVIYLTIIVALMWGVTDGEKLSLIQCVAGIIILLGLYILNKSK